MWGPGAVGEGQGGAVYMTTSVACGWAGAVMQKLHAKEKCYRPTDSPTDTVTYRVACERLKIQLPFS